MRKIALCMELNDYYEHGIARGLVRYAKSRQDWRLYGYGWMFRSLEDLGRWEGDGIIARVEDAATADRLSSLGLPIIDVAGAYTRPGFRSVTNDDFLTGYHAALHLIGCGFKRFAFLGVSGTKWSNLRKEGFERALEQRGLGEAAGRRGDSHRGAWPVFEQSLAWWEGGEDEAGALARFLGSLESPIALFACNDTTGLRATELAGALGIAVPESLAILGVDNEDILCELASPSLSSIQLDCEAIGYRAAAVLDAILDRPAGLGAVTGTAAARPVPVTQGGAGLPEGGRLSVPPREVAERESTRIFACDDELVAKAVTFIRARAHEGIDVSDILAVVSASRRSLEQRFRATMGRSLHEEILRAKLARSKRLLRETAYPLDRVAEESGFGNLGRFHAAFKEAEGLSPGEWRKSLGSQ